MKKVLTKIYDKQKKIYIERWFTKRQFENLDCERYCLPYEVEK